MQARKWAFLQLYSEKCTGRYFKVRDNDLSLKQGSLSLQNKQYRSFGKNYTLNRIYHKFDLIY